MANEYYVDVSTKNESFKNLSKQLSTEGVINSSFLLSVYDKDLVGVHIQDYLFDKTLPDEEYMEFVSKIREECRKNIWYFFREVYRLPDMGSPNNYEKGFPYFLYPSNAAMIWAYINNINVICHSPRQTLRTGTIIGLMLYEKFITGNRSKFSMDNTNDSNTRYLCQRLNTELELNSAILPELHSYTISDKRIPRVLTNPRTMSDKLSEYKKSFITDIEFCKNVENLLLETRRTKIIMESTVNRNLDADTSFLIDEIFPKFKNYFYDCSEHQIDLIRLCSPSINVSFTYKESGLSDEWMNNMKSIFGPNNEGFKQEILLERKNTQK